MDYKVVVLVKGTKERSYMIDYLKGMNDVKTKKIYSWWVKRWP